MRFTAPLRLPVLLLAAVAAMTLGVRRTEVESPVARGTAESAVPDAVDRVAPAVVSLYVTRAAARNGTAIDPLGILDTPSRTEQGIGSGVLLRADGLIVTNHHVVHGATEIRVVLGDRREFRARIVGDDPPTDVALLRISAQGLTVASFGDSSAVRVGESVLAIGNSLGIGQTVSSGIVSAKGRANVGIVDDEDFLQTDAAINPGSSGGPLINLKGEVIGINTAIATRTGGFQGVGFAIPSRLVGEILEILLRSGKVSRGRLGVKFQDVTPTLARALPGGPAQGLIVTDVPEKGAAREAGLRRGDIIVTMDGRPVGSSPELRHRIAMRGAGANVRLEIWRAGRSLELSVRLQPMESTPPGQAFVEDSGAEDLAGCASGLDGVGVQPVTPEMLRRAGVEDEQGGVIVLSIRPSADVTGLRQGDVIVEADRKPVRTSTELRDAIHDSGDPVLVRVRRPEGCVYLSVSK